MQCPYDDLQFVVEKGRVPLLCLKGARIFLTGGTGFFGRWFVDSLAFANGSLDLDLHVTVLTRNLRRAKDIFSHLGSDGSIRFCEGDVRDFTFPTGTFSHVVHLAADMSQINENPANTFQTIVQGTEHVLAFAATNNIKEFLFASSGAVYARQSNAYAEAKRTAESLCLTVARESGIAPKIARCFAFIGPHLPLQGKFAIGNFIADALAEKPITLTGDGSTIRSYMYAADLIVWLIKVLVNGEPGVPYDVGSDLAISTRDLAVLVKSVLNQNLVIEIKGQNVAPEKVDRYIPSIDLAKRQLGLEVWTDLEAAIAKTASWVRQAGLSKQLL